MKKFLIITNPLKDTDLKLTHKIKAYIMKQGGSCEFFTNTRGELPQDAFSLGNEKPPEGTECILVLGGDGTLIRTASALVKEQIPMIGINMGTMGYLCELEASNVFSAIDRLMKNEYLIEERMMLSGFAVKGETHGDVHTAFNDVVIHRSGALSVISIIVYVNGSYLHTFHADGIIISTPTGSTGYSLSAGGPIVDPKAQLIVLTPINAHNLNSKSIVIGDKDEITIEIGTRRLQKDEMAEVSVDGDSVARLFVGEKFQVQKASNIAKICKLNQESFLEILRKKMQEFS